MSAFPEPGLMTWNDDATVMHERAPSGAYLEEWRLVPGSRHPLFADTWRGTNLEGVGVSPDVNEVLRPEALRNGTDNQLAKALEVAASS